MKIKHINHALPAKTHPPMYLMHKFWARKPHNVVAEYIMRYSKEGDIVLDPFCGSGVAPIEAIKLKRRTIGIDINPMAIFISCMTAKPVDLKKYENAFKEIKNKIKNKIYKLYETRCPKCKKKRKIGYIIWDHDKQVKIRYKCENCAPKRKKYLFKNPDDEDRKKLEEIERMKIPFWYPDNKLYYPDGTPFKKKEKSEQISDLFTKRSLITLSIILNEIEKIEDNEIRKLMRFTFSASLHLATKMIPARVSPGGPVWTEPSYWVPPKHWELNVWNNFEERFNKVLRGKTSSESNKIVTEYGETDDFDDIKNGKANIMWICDDALEALRKIPKNSIDFVFTDPTYGESIQYGELCFLWASWLKFNKDYLKVMQSDEVVINKEGQHKYFNDYYNMLYTIFKEVGRALSSGKYMIVTFHNPSFKIRNALERACYIAGFDLENVVYQPPAAIPSSKSSIQPYGSVSGDFYFRFKNVKKPEREIKVDEAAFKRIVLDATTMIIADRGEPTPMPIISNGIEPELCKHGFPFSREKTIEQVIIDNIGKLFVVFDKFGNKIEKVKKLSDKILWLKDPERYLLDKTPLKDRIEKAIVGLLIRRRKVNFTEVAIDLYTRYKNALTPNPPSIRAVLEEYATMVKGGIWKVDPIVEQREKEHSKMIAFLAEIGKKMDYKIWVGIREQSDLYKGQYLSQLCDFGKRLILSNVATENLERIKEIDVLWIKNKKVEYTFEVENTTGFTDAIVRVANVPYETKNFIIIPEERENRLYKKITEPMLIDRIKAGFWKFIFYGNLEEFYNQNRTKKKIDIDNFMKISRVPKLKTKKQITLKEFEKNK